MHRKFGLTPFSSFWFVFRARARMVRGARDCSMEELLKKSCATAWASSGVICRALAMNANTRRDNERKYRITCLKWRRRAHTLAKWLVRKSVRAIFLLASLYLGMLHCLFQSQRATMTSRRYVYTIILCHNMTQENRTRLTYPWAPIIATFLGWLEIATFR